MVWELSEALRCFVKAAACLADLRALTSDSKGAAMLWAAKGLMHVAKTDRHETALKLAVDTIEKVVRERNHGRANG